MAGREREVKVTVLGDSSHGQRALSQLDDQATRTGNHFDGLGGKLASFGKVAALGLAAAAVGVGAFLKSSVDAAEESRKVGAQTEAVIKSTGGAARVTAAEVGKYADQLAALTGVDDEVIASGENMLLTFTNVQNRVGKGNDIFNQGTKAALNMSVALGTDMNSAAMLVGKALNDPIAGMTALTRSGIQFTAQQKDQIKAMVAAGDTLGAQKVILKELETQFAGSAEAAASPMARLKVVVGNLQEELGTRLLPVVGKVASFLADKLPSALDAVGRAFMIVRSGFFEGNVSESTGFMGFLVNVAYQTGQLVEQFKVWWPAIREAVTSAVDAIVGWVREHWPQIKRIITETMETVRDLIAGVVDVITTIWRNFGSQIKNVVSAAWDFISSRIETALDLIQGIIKIVTGIIHGDWGRVWEGIKQILSAAWEAIKSTIELGINLAKEVLSVGWEIVKSIFAAAWDGIFELARKGVANIVDAFLGMVGLIVHAADSAFGWIPGIGDKLHEARVMFDEFRDNVNESLRGIEDKTVNVRVNHVDNYAVTYGAGYTGGDNASGVYALGMDMGPVPGTGPVPIIAHGGEWVVTPEQMARLRGGGGAAGGDGSYAGGWVGASIVINVAGSVVTERQLVEAVQAGLLQKQRRVPTLGLT